MRTGPDHAAPDCLSRPARHRRRGLIVSTNTSFAELFPQDTRARYQGWFTAAFAVASVAGPLLGGFVTDQWHWRWAFYLNLPLGLLSLMIGLFALKLPQTNRQPRIDYSGMILLGIITTTLLLFTHWGGQAFPWVSPPALGLMLLMVIRVITTFARKYPLRLKTQS